MYVYPFSIPPHPHNMHSFHTPSHLFTHIITPTSHFHLFTLSYTKPSRSHQHPPPTVTRSHPHSSDAHDYDLCIKLSDVLTVTAYYKSMFPSIEFTLTNKEVVCPNTALLYTCSRSQHVLYVCVLALMSRPHIVLASHIN